MFYNVVNPDQSKILEGYNTIDDMGKILIDNEINTGIMMEYLVQADFRELYMVKTKGFAESDIQAFREVTLGDIWEALKDLVKRFFEKIMSVIESAIKAVGALFEQYSNDSDLSIFTEAADYNDNAMVKWYEGLNKPEAHDLIQLVDQCGHMMEGLCQEMWGGLHDMMRDKKKLEENPNPSHMHDILDYNISKDMILKDLNRGIGRVTVDSGFRLTENTSGSDLAKAALGNEITIKFGDVKNIAIPVSENKGQANRFIKGLFQLNKICEKELKEISKALDDFAKEAKSYAPRDIEMAEGHGKAYVSGSKECALVLRKHLNFSIHLFQVCTAGALQFARTAINSCIRATKVAKINGYNKEEAMLYNEVLEYQIESDLESLCYNN